MREAIRNLIIFIRCIRTRKLAMPLDRPVRYETIALGGTPVKIYTIAKAKAMPGPTKTD
jgi:hypothetical protein